MPDLANKSTSSESMKGHDSKYAFTLMEKLGFTRREISYIGKELSEQGLVNCSAQTDYLYSTSDALLKAMNGAE